MAITLDTEDRIDRAVNALTGFVTLIGSIGYDDMIEARHFSAVLDLITDEIVAAVPRANKLRARNDD